ncbi:hypothetical protein KOY48_02370 [Candidatus Minimicrobia naudis]|uniref:Uncharacterized protein n=1 Tax=Candidatus Minimicrobia naudis TaxID=2841263 RepID=A0A8F1MBY7_9BACT|nr:hypothetical protein KOY48_02370 [Candidatus Minimicrobia naudis]
MIIWLSLLAIDVLLARVRALLRRPPIQQLDEIFQVGDLKLDPSCSKP